MFNADGSLNWAPNASGATTMNNPLQYMFSTYKSKTSNLIANSILSYEVLPGLEIKTSIGYNNIQTDDFQGFRG